MQRLKDLRHSAYFKYDVAAALLGLGLLVFFAVTAKNGVGMPDEGYYYTVAHRLLLGERMIADEWNLAQLVHLFNLLPNCLYIRLTGGTEGLILFMRHLFIAVNGIFYIYVYLKLRPRRLWGVAAAFLFSAVVQQTLFSIAYFTAAPMAMLAVWLMLCESEKTLSAPKNVFAGFVLACGILAEPFLLLLYVLWFLFTAYREIRLKKRPGLCAAYGFLLNKRTFLWATAGAMLLFFPYMGYLILSGSFHGIGAALPYLTTGAEYNSGNLLDPEKFRHAAELFGLPFMLGMALLSAAAVVVRIRKPNGPRVRRALLLAAGALLAGSYLNAGLRLLRVPDQTLAVSFVQFNNLMMLLFSPIPFLLGYRRQPGLFILWLTGVLFSLLVDLSSTVILASGGGLLRVACILRLSTLLPELRGSPAPEKEKGRSRRGYGFPAAFKAAAALCAAAAAAWNFGYVLCETVHKPVEKLFLFEKGPLTCELERGPFRGLLTTPEIARVYADSLEDLDRVKALANGRPIAIPELVPYAYLYADLPYGAYSAWYEYDEPARLAAYWGLHPTRLPAVIYIPCFTKNFFTPWNETALREKIQELTRFADGETIRGKAGLILVTKRLRFTADGEWLTLPADQPAP